MTRVMLSVPVDDYITPEADDAAMEIARILTRYGARGCFHIVGENARAMRARSRRDFIEALAPHDIGFHSNTHSRPRLPIMDIDELPWDEGVRSFVEYEIPGVRDVAEVFGRWPTYYVHTMASAPQVIYGARLLGMHVVGTSTLPEWPVMRYAGNLLVRWDVGFDPPKVPDDELDIDGRVDKAMASFEAIAAERDPRFPIRLFTHANKYPTYVNADTVNFMGAADTPREEWKVPPMRGKQAAERLMAQFDELIKRVTETPGVEFVTYADVIREMAPGPRWLSPDAVRALAGLVEPDLDPATVEGESLSCAEVFAILCRGIALPGRDVAVRRIIGPREEPAETAAEAVVPTEAFVDACKRADQEIDDTYATPAAIEVEGQRFGPGSWLRAMAAMLRGPGADAVTVAPGPEYPAIAQRDFFQSAKVGWGLYPESFSGENIRSAIVRQSWSAAPIA